MAVERRTQRVGETGLRTAAPRRVRLLSQAQLLWASPARQKEFWARYNFRRNRPAQPLGPLAEGLLQSAGLKAAVRLSPLREAWESIVPEMLRDRCEIECVAGDMLHVRVDDAPTRFALERQLSPTLVNALRRTRAGARIGKIVFRIGAVDAQSGAPASGRPGQ